MKKLINIKNAILFAVSILLLSCSSETSKQEIKPIDEIYPIIDKIGATDGNGSRTIRLYVIDSCEYIGHLNAFSADFLTHKGNCKFCIKRNKNK